MAVTIKPYNATQVAQPGQVAGVKAAQTGIGDLGDGLQKVGQMLYDWQDEADTATAKIADAKYSDLIREELYGDQNGFMYASGGEAMQRRGTVAERLKQAQDAALANLTPAQRARAEGAIQARYQGALQSVDQHTAREGRTYLNDASDARVQMFVNDAIARPDAASVEISRAELEIKDKAKREGWSPEVTALNLEKVRTATHSGIVERIGNVDALGALDYLGKHKDEMSGSEVARLEGLYAPAAKQQKGRRLGDEAALTGVSTQYLGAIRASESGGNDYAKNPTSSATGRYQFIASTWAQVMAQHPNLGLTVDGRTDPVQQELAIRAFTADNAQTLAGNGIEATGGNLYAAHFLGAGGASAVLGADDAALVSDIVAPGVVSANNFLAGMTVADFKQWANGKGGGSGVAYSTGGSGIASILAEEDPVVQRAAFDRYQMIISVQEGEAKAATEAASKAAFASIVNGGSVTTLTPAQQVAIGEDGMKGLIGYEKLVKSGTPVETDTVTLFNMRQLAIDDPAAFKSEASKGFASVADKLSDTDRAQLVKEATSPTAKQDAESAATLRSIAAPQLEAVGIKSGAKDYAKVQTALLQWQAAFIAKNGVAPDVMEIDKQVGRMLSEVNIDPPGLGNQISGKAFEINEPLEVGGEVVPADVVSETVADMIAEGIDVNYETVSARLLTLMGGN